MIALPISLLFYGITREISFRYSSDIFQKIRFYSICAIVTSIVGLLISLLTWDSNKNLDIIAFSILWVGSLHFWNLTWKDWMKFAIPGVSAILTLANVLLGSAAGAILSLLFGLIMTVFTYLKNQRDIKKIPYISASILTVSMLFDCFMPNTIWRGWEGAAVLFALISRLITYLHAIYHQSITDRLTGLYNRVAFTEYVGNFVKSGRKISVIFLDIDNFKQKNDTDGHAAGDQVLIKTAEFLKEKVKGIGVAGRLGGEEMVALIVDEDAVSVAESIRNGLPDIAGVTASLGVAFGGDGISAQQLIENADDAMYQAKKYGKNRVFVSNMGN